MGESDDAALQEALGELEARVQRALARPSHEQLDVIGVGEISPVLRLGLGERGYAAKRLPRFADAPSLERYVETFDAYRGALEQVGVHALESRVIVASRQRDGLSAYCVQPLLEASTLCVDRLRRMDATTARSFGGRLFDLVAGAVSDRLGLDAQLSNWFMRSAPDEPPEFGYLDLTTPLMRNEAGEELLDTELFLASLPALLRPLVRRFMLRDILANYYDLRSVLRDLLGNLIKESLERHLDGWLGVANARITPALTMSEVQAHYADDARTWALLQRLRKLDRSWQRHVRRRPYGFLLPGSIERRTDQ